jgi:hypothetical protein
MKSKELLESWASLHHIVSNREGVQLWNNIFLFGQIFEYGYLEINSAKQQMDDDSLWLKML